MSRRANGRIGLVLALLAWMALGARFLASAEQPVSSPPAPTVPCQTCLMAGDSLWIWTEAGAPLKPFPVIISEEGLVDLPRLGPLALGGLTVPQAEALLRTHAHQPTFRLQVVPVPPIGVFVDGAVRAPGLYFDPPDKPVLAAGTSPVPPRFYLAEALALAGGLTPQANSAAILIHRHRPSLQTVRVNLQNPTQAPVALFPYDVVEVPRLP